MNAPNDAKAEATEAENQKKPKVRDLGLKQLLREATPEERKEIIDGLPHAVGFAKPPEKTRFKKGQSGNPKGRPSGSRNLREVVAEELQQPLLVNEGGKQRKMPAMQVIVRQAVKKAAAGDMQALARVADIARRSGQFEEKHEHVEPIFTPEQADAMHALVALYTNAPLASHNDNKINTEEAA